MEPASTQILDVDGLDALLQAVRADGFTLIGPTRRDGAIVFDEVTGVVDLPQGWTDQQEGGTYRLVERDDDALFGYAVGPHSWKRYLFPPRTLLWRGQRTDDGFDIQAPPPDDRAFAFLAVRGCDLAAIGIQDRVFMGEHPDPTYQARRQQALVIAVNCGTPAATCFCTSMGTGPRVGPGYDLVLTELLDDDGHRFLVEVGTDRGAALLDGIAQQPATDHDHQQADRVVDDAAAAMGRHMRTDDIHDLLLSNLDHERWDEVASRCLACANCTMVCPTCFCSSTEDVTDLTGDHAERWRSWDSCFTLDFSELGGSTVRSSTRSRYRQWMTHKLATWIDQFDSSGCVGCGRCISWCPVGIDITEEVAAIRATQSDPSGEA
jgi:sulfhydrogenase subunit beta (sulfur reductase)